VNDESEPEKSQNQESMKDISQLAGFNSITCTDAGFAVPQTGFEERMDENPAVPDPSKDTKSIVCRVLSFLCLRLGEEREISVAKFS
jgi:hypothetical protein